MSGYSTVGKSIIRVDALQKASGRALYTDDLKLPGMLYGKTLRSPYPHAAIKEIDVSAAYEVPGVKAVVTGRDFPYFQGLFIHDEPFIALDKVRYIGEAVAAVAASTLEAAERGLERIRVVYEPLPAVFDAIVALKPEAPLVHDDPASYPHAKFCGPVAKTNICSLFKLRKGDVDRAFKEADFVLEGTYTSTWKQHASLEPHVAIGLFDPSGRITVWTGNDGPHRCLREIALAMKIPFSNVRVISSFQGGGFGGTGGLRPETIAVALASKANHRPVKVTYSREEVFTSTLVRHPAIVRSKAGVMKNGRIVAKEIEIFWNTGAYGEKGPGVCRNASMTSAGPYNIDNVRIDGYCVYTNNPVSGPMRGFGVPQTAFAYESQMDEIAHLLKMDPLELRLKNAMDENSQAVWGERIISIGLKDCLKKAAQGVAWGEPSKGRNRGKGIACMQKFTSTGQGVTSAVVRCNLDGSLEILTSTMEIGQGSMTVLSQIASEALNVPLEKIRVSLADTDYTPFDASTTGSRSTFHMGNAVFLACQDIQKQAIQLASDLFDVPEELLRFEDGKVAGQRVEGISIVELIEKSFPGSIGGGGDLVGRATFHTKTGTEVDPETGQGKRPAAFWMYGAQAVEVEVDPETGKVEILKLVTAHDVGKVINPTNCEQQMEGAMAMGIGNALLEEINIDDGQVFNPSFESYKIPTSCDLPQDVETLFVEKPHPEGPYGAKGMAEPAIAPTSAAIGNAIFDATGVRLNEVPFAPEKIVEALEKKSST
jgi:CO/xanthine dehydrogenase Mo-binding subunit